MNTFYDYERDRLMNISRIVFGMAAVRAKRCIKCHKIKFVNCSGRFTCNSCMGTKAF